LGQAQRFPRRWAVPTRHGRIFLKNKIKNKIRACLVGPLKLTAIRPVGAALNCVTITQPAWI